MRFELLKILLVDDNPHMRVLLTEVLRAIGVRMIREATDGAQALVMIRQDQFDIVMTDLSMQPLDGIDFVKLVRNSADSPNPMLPIIMITGHTAKRRVAEARDAGVNEILAKPVTAHGLIRRLTEIVEHPRSYIRTGTYFGPDRRRRRDPGYEGPMRRAEDAKAKAADA